MNPFKRAYCFYKSLTAKNGASFKHDPKKVIIQYGPPEKIWCSRCNIIIYEEFLK